VEVQSRRSEARQVLSVIAAQRAERHKKDSGAGAPQERGAGTERTEGTRTERGKEEGRRSSMSPWRWGTVLECAKTEVNTDKQQRTAALTRSIFKSA
jgi:hypothetical protein